MVGHKNFRLTKKMVISSKPSICPQHKSVITLKYFSASAGIYCRELG
jgi:hypothetical protein